MTEAPSHLIALPAGRIRVLRLIAGATTYCLAYIVERGESWCRVCGCTEIYFCAGGCSWVDLAHTICTRCFTKEMLP